MKTYSKVLLIVITTVILFDVIVKIIFSGSISPKMYSFSQMQFNNQTDFILETYANKNNIKKPIIKNNLVKKYFNSINDTYGTELFKEFSGSMNDDVLKVWNENFIKEIYCDKIKPYRKIVFQGYNKWCYSYTPNTNTKHPVYKYIPNAKVPKGKLVFNNNGWTGNNVNILNKKNNIRLAFIGGSTTQQMKSCNFSYTDHVGNYLENWAKVNNINVTFETINTGRVAQQSMDFKAIVEQELVPFNPDIVVYYEGRNQFDMSKLVNFNHYNSMDKNILYLIIGQSFVLQGIFHLLSVDLISFLEKLKKPNSIVINNEFNPNIESPNLPVNMSQIISDIKDISDTLKTINSTLVLSSFAMITDINKMNEAKSKNSIYGYWLNDYGKIKLKEIKRLNQFENLVFKKLSDHLNMPFIDVSSELGKYPNIFYDGIHIECEGTKVHGLIAFNKLLPIIEAKIKEKRNRIETKQSSIITSFPLEINKTSFIEGSQNYYKTRLCN